MPLNIKSRSVFGEFANENICRKSELSAVLEKLTKVYYERVFKGSESYECSLLSARYILEYLFLEHRMTLCDEGYCVHVSGDSSGFFRGNVLEVLENHALDIVVIDRIVAPLYSKKRKTKHVLYIDNNVRIFDWARKTGLNGNIELNVIIDKKELCYENMEINRYSEDHQNSSRRKGLMKLTPKNEECSYERYISEVEGQERGNKTVLYMWKSDDKKIGLKEIPISSYPIATKIYDILQKYAEKHPNEEGVMLVYDQRNMPARFVYSEKSPFVAGYRCSGGVLKEIDKNTALDLFHWLCKYKYEQMDKENGKEQ